MNTFFRDNGLSIVLLSLFLLFQGGMTVVGLENYNQDQKDHHQPTISLVEYLQSGSFMEATMENWESEFLQMFGYVVLTIFLYQRGSSESKSPYHEEQVDRDPTISPVAPDAPWPVRRGGRVLKLYEHSLSITLFLLFLGSFFLHAVGGAKDFNREALMHGSEQISTLGYLATPRFWFESLQNWQSEFFSIGLMVLLSIFLRQKGSPESKAVDCPNWKTGNE